MSNADRLYEAIKHGDDEHRAWLREACDNFFDGKPVPLPRGMGRGDAAEARCARLEVALRAIRDFDGTERVLAEGWGVVAEFREVARAALSDTAQQETPHHPYEGQEDIG